MSRQAIPVAWLLAALAMPAGCSHSAIAPETADPALPSAWARGGDVGAPVENWLKDFGNPQLERLVSEALAENYALRQERARLAQAEQAVTIARADRFPTADVSLDASRRGSDDGLGTSVTSESFDLSAGARWDANLWGRLSDTQRAAQLSLAAQRARLMTVERDLAAVIAGSVFDVMEAQQLLAVARRRLDIAIESADIVASGYRQGLNDALDLYLARNQVEQQQASVAQQEQAYLEAVADLQLSLARYPDGALEIIGELPVLTQPIPAGLPSDLLTRRTDLQEAWLGLLAADAELAVAHKARFPSLTLVGSGGITSLALSDLLDSDASGWSVSSSLVQPLFNAGRLRALEAQALARLELAEQQYLDLLNRAFAEVENAISRSQSLEVRYRSFLDAERNARAALELALEQYQRGLVTYTTVLESQRQAFDAEATVVQLTNQLLQNRIGLYLALGGSFEQE